MPCTLLVRIRESNVYLHAVDATFLPLVEMGVKFREDDGSG
jgi:hypothetical protein